MMRFGLSRGQGRRDPEDDYAERLAIWQIRHGLNRMDLTREQTDRLRTFEQIARIGLDPQRVAFGRWLVRTGRCADDR